MERMRRKGDKEEKKYGKEEMEVVERRGNQGAGIGRRGRRRRWRSKRREKGERGGEREKEKNKVEMKRKT